MNNVSIHLLSPVHQQTKFHPILNSSLFLTDTVTLSPQTDEALSFKSNLHGQSSSSLNKSPSCAIHRWFRLQIRVSGWVVVDLGCLLWGFLGWFLRFSLSCIDLWRPGFENSIHQWWWMGNGLGLLILLVDGFIVIYWFCCEDLLNLLIWWMGLPILLIWWMSLTVNSVFNGLGFLRQGCLVVWVCNGLRCGCEMGWGRMNK